MGVDAQVANAAPPVANASPRKASWPAEAKEVAYVPEPTGSCGREGASAIAATRAARRLSGAARAAHPKLTARAGATTGSSSPHTLGGGSSPRSKAGASAAGEDSVGDSIFGDLRALSDSILRCAGARRLHLASDSSRAPLTASRRAATPRACSKTSR